MKKKKIFSLVNQKGGVGKTTLTFHLSFALNSLGANVLCIDLDPQANLTQLMSGHDLSTDIGIFPLLINSLKELKSLHTKITIKDCFQSFGPLTYIPTNNDLSGFELTVGSLNFPKQLILKKFLEDPAFASFDVILIDGPPTLSLIMVNILCACNGIIVPIKCDEFSLKGLEWIENTLEMIQDSTLVVPAKILGLWPNLVETRRSGQLKTLEKIQLDYSKIPIYPIIANKVHMDTCTKDRKSVFHYQGQVYEEYQKVFTNVAEDLLKS